MAIPQEPNKVKLFIGMLSSDTKLFEIIKEDLKIYGKIDYESASYNWNFTTYYNNELGNNIKRKFIFFENLIQPEKIADIKLQTNKIENKYSINNKRKINLDPGYLTKSKVLLASVKDRAHKVYIRKGIYGDIVLVFINKSFQPFPHTFKDFKTEEYIELFNKVRTFL